MIKHDPAHLAPRNTDQLDALIKPMLNRMQFRHGPVSPQPPACPHPPQLPPLNRGSKAGDSPPCFARQLSHPYRRRGYPSSCTTCCPMTAWVGWSRGHKSPRPSAKALPTGPQPKFVSKGSQASIGRTVTLTA